jgi:biotin transport system substrate-specific component
MAVSTLERLEMAKYRAYRRVYELSAVKKISLTLGFAIVIALLAQLRVFIPGTPVPITMQTLGVLLAGVVMGRNWGGFSVLLYVGLGAAGLPVFNGWSGGMAHLAGPTGGYLIGFVLAAMAVGYFTEKYAWARTVPGLVGLMVFAAILCVYLPGLVFLKFWSGLMMGQSLGWYEIVMMGALPFIAGDLVKAGIAVVAARALLPRKQYTD